MRPFKTYLLFILLFTDTGAFAQLKYSRVKIDIPAAGLSSLQQHGVDFDHGELNKADNTFITTLSSQDLTNLKLTGTKFTVLIDDETANFVKTNNKEDFMQNPVNMMKTGKLHFENSCGSEINSIDVPLGFIAGSYGGYYTFDEMQKRIDSLVNNYPSLVQKIVLPISTYGSRPLIVIKISDNVSADENEPEAFYTGLHHAREGMSMMNLFFFMQYLVENYDNDSKVKDLLDHRELFFMPCVNPDGYVFNETDSPSGGGMWRKNRRNNGSGRFGVDLNRNYSVDWGIAGPNINISTNPSNDSYIGPNAFSEPETQAIRAFAQTRHFTIAIDHHSYGNYYVTPYGIPASHPFTSEDVHFYNYASALMGRYNGYFAGDGMETVNYYAVGNSRDYHISGDIGIGTKQKTYGYTVEIGPGSGGFWPNASSIIPLAKSMFFANMQMAYMAGSYFELQDLDKIAVSNNTGDFNFSLRRIGLSDKPVTVSLIPLENIQSAGPAVTVNSISNYFDSVQRSISYTLTGSVTPGAVIKFAYQISSDGITLMDTIEKIFQPTVLVNDDMEGTISSNWTLTGNWQSCNTAAFKGSHSLSESPGGNYSSNESTSATYKTNIDLSGATSAYLSFWVKHRAQNSLDKLQIQLSANGNGGSANFQSVCGSNTISENTGTIGGNPALTGIREAWTREVIDLRDYLGNSTVGLRFRFTSNSSSVDDGFYIDDIEIVKSLLSTLAVKFINITAKRSSEGALITWEAATDEEHDHFEVQSSVNGRDFTKIGTVRETLLYQFLDVSRPTDKFYRIKAVTKNGTSTFSKSVFLSGAEPVAVNIFPNPVEDIMYVRINLHKQSEIKLTITDMSGRKKHEQKLVLQKGINYKNIQPGPLSPQVYLVRIKDMVTGEETIIKMIKK